VRLPTAKDLVSPEIRDNPNYWPFFKDCLGVLDCIHFDASPPVNNRPAWRNRKGYFSQKCLFGCLFDLMLVYSFTGWEGSATDACVYEDPLSTDLKIPEGKYYLAGAGCPLSDEVLVPYRGEQYHIAERLRVGVRYSISSICSKAMCLFVDLSGGPPTKKNSSTSVMHQRAM
jgi:hypothetical protein